MDREEFAAARTGFSDFKALVMQSEVGKMRMMGLSVATGHHVVNYVAHLEQAQASRAQRTDKELDAIENALFVERLFASHVSVSGAEVRRVLTDERIYSLSGMTGMYADLYTINPGDACRRFARAIEREVLARQTPPESEVQADEAKLYRDLTGDAMALGYDGIVAALEALRQAPAQSTEASNKPLIGSNNLSSAQSSEAATVDRNAVIEEAARRVEERAANIGPVELIGEACHETATNVIINVAAAVRALKLPQPAAHSSKSAAPAVPVAWAFSDGLERLARVREGHADSPLLVVHAKDAGDYNVPLYATPTAIEGAVPDLSSLKRYDSWRDGELLHINMEREGGTFVKFADVQAAISKTSSAGKGAR